PGATAMAQALAGEWLHQCVGARRPTEPSPLASLSSAPDACGRAMAREAWAAQFLTRQQGWQQLASRLRCGLQPLDTSRTPIEQLRQLLSAHARRRH
ncbi:MAG: hypothetical protein QNL70_11665, partial [Pseudomonas sp.]